MIVRAILSAAAIFSVSSTALAADAASAPAQDVKFCGTVTAMTEAGCIGVTSGGQTYDISGANPKPAVGKMISGSGKVSNDPNTCMEGTRLSDVTWQETEACTMGGQ
jgi:hypothetical protein